MCDGWADEHADPMEHVANSGLSAKISFRDDLTFDNFEKAKEFLESIPDSYHATAVKYYDFKEPLENKNTQELSRRIAEYKERVDKIETTAHFANIKSQFIKCKNCGSTIATAYCGKSWRNNCPVCRNDMRPVTELNKLEKYKETINELKEKLTIETEKLQAKQKKNAIIKWAVHCEVHI